MEGIKETNEVEFEEVKKVGFLGSLKLLFKKSPKMVTVQPETMVETFEPVPVIPEKAEEVKPKRFVSLFKKTKKEIPEPVTFEPVKLKPPEPLFKETKKEMPETVLKPPEFKPVETGAKVSELGILKPTEVEPMEAEKSPETAPPEFKPLTEVAKTEQKTTPMVKILPREEVQPIAGEKGLVEVAKPVKLERVVLGFDEEKEIVKLESRLRKMRLSLEKALKEEQEELDKRKEEIEQLDATLRKYQLQREEELNRRESEALKIQEMPKDEAGKTEHLVTPVIETKKEAISGEKTLVELVKPVKLERIVLGAEEEKEIVKLESRLRKMRVSLEKILKEEQEKLDKRKEEIEQFDATFKKYQLQREETLNGREAQLKIKEKQLGTIISSHLIGREEKLNKREMELITKERDMRQKIDEEMKKLVEREKEIIVKEKELDSTAREYQLDREEELNKKEMGLLEREKMLGVGFDEDVKKLLIVMDELLGKLPKDVIDEFVKSEDYKLYEKVLDRYGV